MKTFFLEKNSFFVLFSNFYNFQNFLIVLPKNLLNRAEKTLYEILPFNTLSTANLPPLSIMNKTHVFFEKTISFFKKPNLRNLTISVAFYGNFATIGKKNSHSVTRTYCRYWCVGVNAIGKHRVKKQRQKWIIREKGFAFIFLGIWR